MLQVFPEIHQKITTLNALGDDGNHWEEREKLNKELIEIDGFRKYALQIEILKYFGFSDDQLDYNVLQLSG